jgi:phage tail sheath gpL-like
MSIIDSTSEAAAVGVGVDNVQFAIAAQNVPAKIAVTATYDPLKTSVVDEVPVRLLNEADAGDRFGFGWPLHGLIKKIFEGSNGAAEVWAIPQSETGTASDGEIAWTGTTSAAGTVPLRIGGELYSVSIPTGSTIEETSDLVVAFVNAVADTPVIAAKTAVTFETTFTSKAKGIEQDNIIISLAAGDDESLPTGLAGVITPMSNGAGTPDIQGALNGMGTGDEANQKFFTDLVHGYGIDTGTLDKVSAYVGLGNTLTGLYSKLIGRPFTSLSCDTDPGSAALAALIVITDARKTDRANGILGAPDEEIIPTELAALATGIIAATAQNNPAEMYTGKVLTGAGGLSVSAQRWTKDYSSGRDAAVKAGISPTKVVDGTTLLMQNIVTFYRPSNVPISSNGYKSFRSIKIIQNMLFNLRLVFESEAWQGISIVADSSKVTDPVASLKARDVLDVVTELNNFSDLAEGKSWIFDAAFSKENSTVAIRTLSNGFDINYKWKMSGEAQIYSITQQFDTNISS